MDKDESQDERLEYIQRCSIISLRYKPEKFDRFLQNEVYKNLLIEFFSKQELGAKLILTENQLGQIVAYDTYPSVSKLRGVFFIKVLEEPITPENYYHGILSGDLSNSPLEQLKHLTDEVLVPILCNSENHTMWPDVVAEDVVHHAQNFQSIICKAVGHFKGRTILPMPLGIDRIDKDEFDLSNISRTTLAEPNFLKLLHDVENTMIQWTQQIHEVVEKDSAQSLLEGLNPDPFSEVEFWADQYDNLLGLYQQVVNMCPVQLKDPRVQKMAKLLEKAKSCYVQAFREMFREVVGSLAEARDITLHLKPLEKHFVDMQQEDFSDLKPKIPGLMHSIAMLWCFSDYFRTPYRIIVLIQKVCNLIINMGRTYLDPANILQSELDESLVKVKSAISVLKHFLAVYQEYRTNLPQILPSQNLHTWEFPDRRVFERFNRFLSRLLLIELCGQEFFETADEFLKLEKLELGGIKGRSLGTQVTNIYDEFCEKYASFSLCTYDPLDPDSKAFDDDYVLFKQKVDDWDRRLGALLARWFDDCPHVEAAFKAVQMMGNLMERKVIQQDFAMLQPAILSMIHKELDDVKVIFDQKCRSVQDFLPPVSGRLLWSHMLQERASAPIHNIRRSEHLFEMSDDLQLIYKKYQEMMTLLQNFDSEVYEEWVEGVEPILNEDLKLSLIIRSSEEDRKITINFSRRLQAVIKEVKYLRMLERADIPRCAMRLFEDSLMFYNYTEDLQQAASSYNQLLDTILPVELPLITSQLEHVDYLISLGEDSLNWVGFWYVALGEDSLNWVGSALGEDSLNWVGFWYVALGEDSLNWARMCSTPTPPPTPSEEEEADDILEKLIEEDRAATKARPLESSIEDLAVTKTASEILEEEVQFLVTKLVVEVARLQGEDEPLPPEPAEAQAAPAQEEVEEQEYQEPSPMVAPVVEEEVVETKLAVYIRVLKENMLDLSGRVEAAKDNVASIQQMTQAWSKHPLFDRREAKMDTLLALEEKADRVARKTAEIKTHGREIHDLLNDNKNLFKVAQVSPAWRNYVDYVDTIVKEGIMNCIDYSLQFFLDNTDENISQYPLLEVKLELLDKELLFTPSLETRHVGNLLDIVQGLLVEIFTLASHIQRLSLHIRRAYLEEAEKSETLGEKRGEMVQRTQDAIYHTGEFKDTFLTYNYLWEEDREEVMSQFLLYGGSQSLEDLEDMFMRDEPVEPTPPSISQFKDQIDSYESIYEEINNLDNNTIVDGWLKVDIRMFKHSLMNIIKKWSMMFKKHLADRVENSLTDLETFILEKDKKMQKQVEEGDFDGLIDMMNDLMAVRDRQKTTDGMFEPLQQTVELLRSYGVEMQDEIHLQLQELPERWNNTKKIALSVKQHLTPLLTNEANVIRRKSGQFDMRQSEFREEFIKSQAFNYDCPGAYRKIDQMHQSVSEMEAEMKELQQSASLFEVTLPEFKQLIQCRKEIRMLKQLWDYIYLIRIVIEEWKKTLWKEINVEFMDMECKRFGKEIRGLDKEMRPWDGYIQVEATVKNMLTSLRAVVELQNPAIRDRHWKQLMQATKVPFVMDDSTTLADLLSLNLHKYEDEVRNIVDKSVKEMAMEKVIKELESTWSVMVLGYETHLRTGLSLVTVSEELIEVLEDNQVQLQNLMTSKYIDFFLEEISGWQQRLSQTDQVLSIFMDVQRTWSHLESIFIASEDIRSQLPEDSKRFDKIDSEFRELLQGMSATPNAVQATNKPGIYEKLEDIQDRLTLCEKALAEYLETKRLAFPRFYFVSGADLLDILSNGNQPEIVSKHLTKLFDSLAKLKFYTKKLPSGEEQTLKLAYGMFSKDGEYVKLDKDCDCSGKVEGWLNRVLEVMRSTVRKSMTEAVVTYEERPREVWLFEYPAQVSLCGTQIWWTTEVNAAFARMEEGYENALKEYFKKQTGLTQVQQLNTMILMLLGQLTSQERQKIMTVCTIDVHARDVVNKMIQSKVETSSEFMWQSQLRHRWDDRKADCFANICDAQFRYSHEYLGNTPRLVITPLTDRCYITLTQSLHLIMGGAPAGPAGTGKTETTKDLGRALGIMVYVFNCSEQMDYKSVGNIYKGLAQTGAWGCFDEFNRISVEVLSVVAVQVKSVQDAIRYKKKRFNFLGEEIIMTPTVGIFITMNPGYAGRTELPENLKALFRPCAMVVPDFELIAEIMLVAEGFLEARILARKFLTLYNLCKELLSKQDHYDWGLRAIKSVLVVAGSLKRGDPDRAENQVLMRALRDFNIPKIVTDDVPIFMGLIGDLFPSLDVPRKRDLNFEALVKKAAVSLKLQPEDNFILKVVQLEELLHVRHSVFVDGAAGSGKTMVCKTLFKTYQLQRRKPVSHDLDPKAVTNDELFGIINPATREWKDGLFSTIMRDLAYLTGDGPKWIILDGDIDPMWIESLNTVMDDNKGWWWQVLTLASNERIPLTPSMRLVFEISNLRTATPATVSRAGILFLNASDLGWNPYVTSWIDTREVQSEKANLMILFDKYVPPCLESGKVRFKKITPIPEISLLQMLCFLLDCLLTPENTPPDCPKEVFEQYFVFCCVWAFGSALFQDQLVDYRVEFSKWFVNEFKTIKFPTQGTVFDYYIDSATKKFIHWQEKVPEFILDPELPLQAILVHTAETSRVRYFLDILMNKKHPVMLVGPAGSGKTVIINEKLDTMPEGWLKANVPFNFYTSSEMLQKILEKPLEKKAGRNYGPPGNNRLVYFIDDMNMPEVPASFTYPHCFS
ncbi:DNAH9 [Cordylochernes scorpioides]|uniref:DNAH9 n=1 Tax=Cordylochernes scorpioides TaxID=51811 RepID=A0ABY6KAH0_9ARAC|nr:DNAH9 [Cordylochernes scorpioides]